MAVIISTRPLDDALIDADVLSASGISCLPAPMMEIKPLPIDAEQLFDDVDAEAMALTSRHAVGLVAASRWAEKPVFCVGESTARLAQEAGFKKVITGPGDGHGLAEVISQSKYKKIFWPSAVDVGFDLAKPLSEHGIHVERHAVYKAAETKMLPEDVVAAFKNNDVTAVMVHSGRAGIHLTEVMAEFELSDIMKDVSIIAVSGRVGAQCEAGQRKAGQGKTGRHHGEWRRIIIASTPRRSAMFEAVIALVQEAQSERNPEGDK